MNILFPKALVDGDLNKKSAGRAIRHILENWLSAGKVTEPEVEVHVSELRTDPAVVENCIDNWNKALYKAFQRTVEELDEICDTQKTFACKIAARDIDNDWNPLSKFTILSDPDENPNFVNTCVNGWNEKEIRSRPENYAMAVCSVNIKE